MPEFSAVRSRRLVLLGRWDLVVDGESIQLGGREQRLSALLALSGRRARSQVAGVLWPESTDARALASLRRAVLQTQRRSPGLLRADRTSIGLHPDVVVDVDELRAAVACVGEVEPDSALLRALAGGELLPDWYDEWVEPERERIQQQRVRALEQFARRALDGGDPALVVDAARAAASVEPLLESASELAIRGHLARGDRASAAHELERYSDLVREELGEPPSPALVALLSTPREVESRPPVAVEAAPPAVRAEAARPPVAVEAAPPAVRAEAAPPAVRAEAAPQPVAAEAAPATISIEAALPPVRAAAAPPPVPAEASPAPVAREATVPPRVPRPRVAPDGLTEEPGPDEERRPATPSLSPQVPVAAEVQSSGLTFRGAAARLLVAAGIVLAASLGLAGMGTGEPGGSGGPVGGDATSALPPSAPSVTGSEDADGASGEPLSEIREVRVRSLTGAKGAAAFVVRATRLPARVRLEMAGPAGLDVVRNVVVRSADGRRLVVDGLDPGTYRWSATSSSAEEVTGKVRVIAEPTVAASQSQKPEPSPTVSQPETTPVASTPTSTPTPTPTPTQQPSSTPTQTPSQTSSPAPSPSPSPSAPARPTSQPTDPGTTDPGPVG